MSKPLVGIIMGSNSDWETMRHAAETLDKLGVPHEVKISPPTGLPSASTIMPRPPKAEGSS